MWEAILEEQANIAKKFGAKLSPPESQSMVGAHFDEENEMPINGLRHPPQGGGNGWFIWSGNGEIPSDPKFFQPVHVEHIFEKYPTIAKYLSLAPGWRFQIDNKGYEDVWYDEKLLDV